MVCRMEKEEGSDDICGAMDCDLPSIHVTYVANMSFWNTRLDMLGSLAPSAKNTCSKRVTSDAPVRTDQDGCSSGADDGDWPSVHETYDANLAFWNARLQQLEKGKYN